MFFTRLQIVSSRSLCRRGRLRPPPGRTASLAARGGRLHRQPGGRLHRQPGGRLHRQPGRRPSVAARRAASMVRETMTVSNGTQGRRHSFGSRGLPTWPPCKRCSRPPMAPATYGPAVHHLASIDRTTQAPTSKPQFSNF